MSLDNVTRQALDLTETLAATEPADVAAAPDLQSALQKLMEACEAIEQGVALERRHRKVGLLARNGPPTLGVVR